MTDELLYEVRDQVGGVRRAPSPDGILRVTIGNPEAHAERLIGQRARLVAESGAPTGPRHVVVYNPPVVNAELRLRASTTKTAVRLAAEEAVNPAALAYINRLSDYLFVFARMLNENGARDVKWVPGANR